MRFLGKGSTRMVAVLFALLLTAVAAEARELFKADLDVGKGAQKFTGEKVPTDKGSGWRSRDDVDGLPNFDAVTYSIKPGTDFIPEAGAIEISIKRSRDGGSLQDRGTTTYNTLFDFVGPDNSNLLSAYILWEFRGNSSISGITINSDIKDSRHFPWGGIIPFNRKIKIGEWVDLKFTWGPGNNRIFVDGVEVPVYYGGMDGVELKPEMPINPNAGDRELVDFLKDAQELMIGSDFAMKSGKRVGYYSLYNSVLGSFAITDTPSASAPAISSLEHDALHVAGFSGSLVAGNTLAVAMKGTPGAVGTFDLVHFPDVGKNIDIDWRGWGVYLEDKVFYEEGEVNLRDVESYEVYAALTPFDYAAPGMEPIAKLKVGEQFYTLETPEVDKPYYIAVVALMRDGTKRPVIAPIMNQSLVETEPGVYAGSYQVGWKDRYARAAAIGRLTSGTNATTLSAAQTFVMNPALTISVATEPKELLADEKSQASVTVILTDANGNAVSGHEVKFLMFTTSQYTGVVGGGAFADQVGGTVKEISFGKTDLFGKVTATYVAGFAAKTAIIVARDMLSNSAGSGWVKTYIKATAQLELTPVQQSAAMDQGYSIAVTSSDDWLTADGKSQARITARVTLGGKPVEGHAVTFNASSGNGSVRTVSDTTDKKGEARAVYTAGKKIGIVVVTATDTTVGISGSVSIELRSDAPAKIAIKLDPDKLPADGRSTADLLVQVTDINDNPNDNVEVEYLISGGSGRIKDDKGMTDRKGENKTRYTAGKSAGTVTFEITVRSTIPTDVELAKARSMALAVTDFDFF